MVSNAEPYRLSWCPLQLASRKRQWRPIEGEIAAASTQDSLETYGLTIGLPLLGPV
jgi:hypothetical protein